MERISSSLFMLALLLFYIPKFLKLKKSKFIKAHIAIGIISILAMCTALIQRIGTSEIIKYIGFSSIMVAIGITGYFSMKKSGVGRILHIVSTIGFFIYLFTVIVILK
ncbi:MAG: hypothetical protein E7212_03050 [Clostridium sartagoforme]|nr:hypothetical protein [Clostridium sartagoforme]